jgi:hypothetical protein
MSVTFTLAIDDADFLHFEICDLETERTWTAPDYESAKLLWDEVGATHQGYWTFSPRYAVDSSRDADFANAHAREILGLLGIDDDELCGSMDATDFRGRCLVALALAPAVELPEAVDTGANGAKVIHAHRRASYVPEKLTALAALAELAEENNRMVSWG